MKGFTPLPTWRKWLYRILGGFLVLGCVLTIPRTVTVVLLVKAMWSAKGGVSDQALADSLAYASGHVVAQIGFFVLGIWLLRRSWRKVVPISDEVVTPVRASAPVSTPALAVSRSRAGKRVATCNVLMPSAQIGQLWQFNAASSKFNLVREESKLPGEPLPEKLIGKDWQTLLQPKLNIAWLPADKVFLRVIQLPKSDFAETQSMVELQLEKLSPLPVAQVVWGFEPLSSASIGMQTVIVIIVARAYVEEFLGMLEGQGYLADRLELPFLDQLRATKVDKDGAWIYPGVGGDQYSCLAAWWYGGTLQNLSLVHLPASDQRGAALQEQLAQMTWAGELEGWLISAPRYHLVADEKTAQAWIPFFNPEQPLEVVPPLLPADVAALTARRAATNSVSTNLLPPEYSARYRQQFIDRLWMRGLGAVLMVYVAFVVLYLGWVQFAKWRHNTVAAEIASLGLSYTNTLQLKERVKVLQDQLDLQFAALDSWKATADFLPPELTLNSLNFDRGRKLTLLGTASNEDVSKVNEFNGALRGVTARNQPLFSKVNAPSINPGPPGGQQITWSFFSELKRTDNE